MPAPDHNSNRTAANQAPGEQRPSARQLAYLRALAQRTGQTFTWPATRAQASREIRRLRSAVPSSRVERAIEEQDWAGEAAARECNCDVPIRPEELQGYGSSATWRRRS
jgi:hypothetical protein